MSKMNKAFDKAIEIGLKIALYGFGAALALWLLRIAVLTAGLMLGSWLGAMLIGLLIGLAIRKAIKNKKQSK